MDMFPFAALLAQKQQGQEQLVYTANFNPTIPFSFLALRDLAEAAAVVLDQRERHFYVQYPLVSTARPVSYTEVVAIASELLGREIRIETRPLDEAVRALLKVLFGGEEVEEINQRTVDAAQRMLLFYNHRGLIGNPNVLEWLIGRKPTTHREWMQLQLEKAAGKEA